MSETLTREELEAEVNRLNRLATDRRYMMDAYRIMLGPIGERVAAMWHEKRVQRVHHSWGPAAAAMTGEERAQVILDAEEAMKTSVRIDHIDDVRPPSPIKEE